MGGDNRRWIERLFQAPEVALEEAERGVWPRVSAMSPSIEEVARFLGDEARKLEEAWTSASRSE